MSLSDAELGKELLRRATESDCCCGPDRGLLTLLEEDAAIYEGRGAVDADRLRAFVMECVTRAGLASEALDFIQEELATALDPYAVAAAARALRHVAYVPPEMEELVHRAAVRILPVDAFVCLDAYPSPVGCGSRTATAELAETVAVLQMQGRRDGSPEDDSGTPPKAAAVEDAILRLRDVELEDQDRQRTSFGNLFLGRPSAIAFFYTRCMNPEKCSRTIAKLGLLQDLVRESRGMVAGITYDPAYDTAEKLRRYGEDRGFRFNKDNRLLRSTGSFGPVRDAFQLRVGYGPTTVNRHAVEIFVATPDGRLTGLPPRQRWDEQDIATAVRRAAVG